MRLRMDKVIAPDMILEGWTQSRTRTIPDWKLVGDQTLTEFQLQEIQYDWKEEHDLAAAMP